MRLIIPIGKDPDIIRNFYNQNIYDKEYGIYQKETSVLGSIKN